MAFLCGDVGDVSHQVGDEVGDELGDEVRDEVGDELGDEVGQVGGRDVPVQLCDDWRWRNYSRLFMLMVCCLLLDLLDVESSSLPPM